MPVRRDLNHVAAAIDRIESIVKAENIACDFQRLDGYLFDPQGDRTDILDRELVSARKAGLTVEMVRQAPIASFDTGRALRFANLAQFHPLKYLSALSRCITRDGG